MKIASYALLSLLSFVEVLAEETPFDRAVEAYRTHQKALRSYQEAINTYEETKLTSAIYRATDLSDDEALKKARAAFEKARDENKEVKDAYAVYEITAYGYDKALHQIEEVKLAFAAWEEAKKKVEITQRADKFNYATWKKADTAWEKATDNYTTIMGYFHDAVKEAYKKSEKHH